MRFSTTISACLVYGPASSLVYAFMLMIFCESSFSDILEEEISEQTSSSFVSYNLSENQGVNVSAGNHRSLVLCILISCVFL